MTETDSYSLQIIAREVESRLLGNKQVVFETALTAGVDILDRELTGEEANYVTDVVSGWGQNAAYTVKSSLALRVDPHE